MTQIMMVPAGDVIPIFFSSYDGVTGASETVTGLAVTDIEIYKDGGVTQRASDAGYTLLDTDGIDFDGITGIHGFSIDTGDNTDAGFYTVGAWFTVVVSSVTADGQTVNFIPAQFRLMAAEAVAAVPKADATHFAGTAYATALAAEVDAVWDEVLTGASHNVASSAGRRLRTLQDVGNYIFGAVWVDTNGANTGSTFPDDGTFLNPVNTLARALTVAAAATQPVKRLFIMAGSSITLAGAYSGWAIEGDNYTIALGGQSISNTHIEGAASVTGTATGTTPSFKECHFGAATLPPSTIMHCGFMGTLTLGSAGDFIFTDCYSEVAGTSTPVIDMGAAVGATNVSIRRWSGGLTFNNIAAGDVISIDAISGGTVTLNGADGNVQVRGMVNVVDNRTGTPTLGTTNNMDARFDSVDAAIAAVFTTAMTESYAADGATPTAAQALYLIQQRLTEMAQVGTTITVNKLDGTTPAATLTLDSATAPTTVTRAT